MLRTVLTGLACALISTAAFAQNKVQGNWEGEFASGNLKGTALTAKIVGESDVDYLVMLTVGEGTEVQFHGKTENGMTTFFGGVDLGEKLGGRHAVTAMAADGALNGSMRADLQKSSDFQMKRVEKASPTMGMTPPAGAVALMDGKSLDKWTTEPVKWRITEDGAAEVSDPSLRTLDEYGSGTYHIEFRTPYMPSQRGQGRGNSGVYLLGRYEMQVLDSWPLPPADNEAGGIYKQAVPKVNASFPPEEWQTYDIDFTAPEFDAAGKKIKNARISAKHNGAVIHDDLELTDVTPGGVSGTEAPKGTLLFQNHHNPVRYRNVWFLAK